MKTLDLRGISASGAVDGTVPTVSGGQLVYAQPSGGGSYDPAAGRSPRLLPYGVRLRGVNISAKQYGDSGDKPWGRMFGEWDTLWDTYIQPQIDAAAAVGANAVRMMGAAPGVLEGLCTEAQYLEGYERLVDYCAAQGMWVYGVLSASQEWFGRTVAEVMPVMEAQAAMLDTKANVFAIDVCQEIGLTPGFISSSSTLDAATQLVTPIRAVTTLPLTCSVTVPNNTSAGAAQFAATTVTDYDSLFDFFAYHPYYDGMTVADAETASDAAEAVGKVILFGEYGATSTDVARYEAVAEVQAALPNLIGSFQWAVADRLGDSAGEVGMFTETFTPRTTLVEAFKTVPDTEGPRRPGPVILDHGSLIPARGRLNFAGDLEVTDDSATDTITVSVTLPEIPEPATSVGELLMQDGVTGPPVPLETEARDDWLYQG